MRPRPYEPQPLSRVIRRGFSWFVTCVLFPSLVGAIALTYAGRADVTLNVDGAGGAQQITEDPDEPKIWIVTPAPAAPKPAPVQTAAPTEATPKPSPGIDLPPLEDPLLEPLRLEPLRPEPLRR